jgi:hypothetical protein
VGDGGAGGGTNGMSGVTRGGRTVGREGDVKISVWDELAEGLEVGHSPSSLIPLC